MVRNESGEQQSDDLDSLSDDGEPDVDIMNGKDDFVNSLMNPVASNGSLKGTKPIPIMSLDDDETADNLEATTPIEVDHGQFPIVRMEHDEDTSDVDRHQATSSFAMHSAFQDVNVLLKNPRHILVMLKFMYTEGTHPSLLFYLLSSRYFDPRVPHPKGADGLKMLTIY